MFRLILLLLAAVLLPTIIRAVLAIVGSAMGNATGQAAQGAPNKPGNSKAPGATTLGELKKDPVCGTFISTTTAFQKVSQGETYYFCSTQCRDSFQG